MWVCVEIVGELLVVVKIVEVSWGELLLLVLLGFNVEVELYIDGWLIYYDYEGYEGYDYDEFDFFYVDFFEVEEVVLFEVFGELVECYDIFCIKGFVVILGKFMCLLV